MPRLTKKYILKNLYFNAEFPSSFSSVNKLYKAAKQVREDITIQDVKSFLHNTYTYTSHRKVQRHFPRRKIIVRGINDQWQADLIDVSGLKNSNDGYRYLLVVIDCFSRVAYVEPMKRKFALNTLEAFKKILESAGTKPRILQVDEGSEFKQVFRNFLKDEGITFFHTSQDTKCAIVERFNRTLQNKLYRSITARGNLRYIDILQDIVESYNYSKHRSLGMSPKDVNKNNERKLWIKQYGNHMYSKKAVFAFQIGDKVRVSKYKKTFERGYLPKWQKEVFTIKYVLGTRPETYVIADKKGEILKGSFYKQELIKVTGA